MTQNARNVSSLIIGPITVNLNPKTSIFNIQVEAIIEDDSTVETRWRYFLRYMQGQLNR